MKYKVGVWGQYGDGGKIADGQAVRTTVITHELKQRYGDHCIGVVNTNGWRKNPFRLLFQSIFLIAQSENVIVLPADNGFKVFVPLLIRLNMIFRRKLIYVVIGGFLPELLGHEPKYKKFVNRFAALFVQTNNLKKDLEAEGIKDIHILSNLKRLNSREPKDIIVNTDPHVKVCVFSRITKEKGVEDAIEAVKLANRQLNGKYITLDFYGLLPETYKQRFEQLMIENQGIAAYKGIADYNKTVETLSQYFVMLFPTYYHGEGFPGNIIDAYNTGLPIIATNWLYNKDFIKEGENGLLVPIQSPEKLANAIVSLYKDRNRAYKIALQNLAEAKKYHPDAVMKELYEFIEQ